MDEDASGNLKSICLQRPRLGSIVRVLLAGRFHGMQKRFPTWKPTVERPSETSLIFWLTKNNLFLSTSTSKYPFSVINLLSSFCRFHSTSVLECCAGEAKTSFSFPSKLEREFSQFENLELGLITASNLQKRQTCHVIDCVEKSTIFFDTIRMLLHIYCILNIQACRNIYEANHA